MHVSLPISKETVLMGSDTGGEWASNYSQGNNFSISINTINKLKPTVYSMVFRLEGRLPCHEQNILGDYFGMFTDKFGVNWMVSF
jgi:PhnB protein